jgi:hypothetical protein
MSNEYRDKLLSVGHLAGGLTRDRVHEGRDKNGHRYKAVTDQLGNVVTQRVGDRQDVTINAPAVQASMTINEVRD